jgi:hypothetical protein
MDLRPTQGNETALCLATALAGGVTLPFVISTGAYPDFLPRGTNHDHECGSR